MLDGYCNFGGRLFFGRNEFLGFSRLEIWGRWFHSTLFFLYFTEVGSGISLCGNLRVGSGFSIAPE